jgi:membrane peptidoglycan carboxypeptidase
MLDYINNVMSSIDNLAKIAGIDKDKLNKGIESKIKELDDYKKRYNHTIDKLSDYIATELVESSKANVERMLDYDRHTLRLIATKYADATGGIALLLNGNGEVVAVSGGKHSAKEAIEKYAKDHGKHFKGGGSERIAEGVLA